MRSDASNAALWRLLEWSRFRSHVYAIRHRGDELFEDRETPVSCQWYSDLVKELAYRRLSYTVFEKHFEVYPRIHIIGKDLETEDALWRDICLLLLEHPMGESPLSTYNRLALYDLTKNQFKTEADLVGMAKYYSVVLFKVRGVRVAPETVQIIERMVDNEAENHQELAINYYYYQMKDQWSMGLFSQAV